MAGEAFFVVLEPLEAIVRLGEEKEFRRLLLVDLEVAAYCQIDGRRDDVWRVDGLVQEAAHFGRRELRWRLVLHHDRLSPTRISADAEIGIQENAQHENRCQCH